MSRIRIIHSNPGDSEMDISSLVGQECEITGYFSGGVEVTCNGQKAFRVYDDEFEFLP